MTKISGLSGVVAAFRQLGTGQIDKPKSAESKATAAGTVGKKVSIEKHIGLYIASLSPNDHTTDDYIVAFVKGALTWEWGIEVESDPTFTSLVAKIVDDIKGHAELKQQVTKIIKGFD